MKKLIVLVVILAALGTGGWAYYQNRNRPEPQVTTMPVGRGDVIDAVQATGTLEAVTTVDVGTQVSGLVQDLYADFNTMVRKNQIIARLDPSIIQTQIEQQEANVVRAEADLERLKVTLTDAEQKFERAKQMAEKSLIPRTELEAAELNVKSTQAQIRSSDAGLTQARANLNQQKVNLGHTVIKSPIDGIVISRSVEPGQTVAASMNAPVLYQIAADLTKMQVLANIDEADVGRMRQGQHVTFRVDAYANETFEGTVEQVRLQPTVVQNVVVYSTVIAAPNPQYKLKPGMTANVAIEVAKREDVLRIPAAATRFRPTDAMFQVLNQPVPQEMGRGNAGGRGRGGREGGAGPGAAAPGGTATAGAAQVEQQMARGGAGRGAGTARKPAPATRDLRRGIAGSVTSGEAFASGAQTIDSLFAPLPPVESRGRAWVYEGNQLKPVNLRLGITDGTWLEVLSGEVKEGQEVVVNMVTGLELRTAPGQQQGGNPLMGPQRGGGPGGRGGGGRGF